MPIKWIEPLPVIPGEEIQAAYPHNFIVAEQLAKRGIYTHAQAMAFLSPQKSREVSPFDFPDMDKAVERVLMAIKNRHRILVWGDFDVDGQTSTALLVDGLRKLGADVRYHIPVRSKESHGIQPDVLKELLAEIEPQLIITCDTGITEFKPLAFLAAQGIDAIITDHHTPAETLPPAFAIINPRLLPDGHPLSALAGVGAAFQLISALFERAESALPIDSYHDLVALGTIADMAELTGENRYYVKSGLGMMNSQPRAAFSAMAKTAGFREPVINEMHIGFTFAPRLNALGRLGDANPTVDFLISGKGQEIAKFAASLEALNNQRKLDTNMVLQSALGQLESKKELLQYPVIVLLQKDWEKGVVGIAAHRLTDNFNKPVILLSGSGEEVSGSARSVEGINLIQAIRENSRFLTKFGGHPMAAGLSLPSKNIAHFREGLSQSVLTMTAGHVVEKTLEIDAYLPLDSLKEDLLLELEQLAPFGKGNTAPLIVSRNLKIEKFMAIGKTEEHRKLVVTDLQGNLATVLWWNCADSPLPDSDSRFDLAYTLRRDNFNDKNNVVLEWVDFRASEESSISVVTEKSRFIIHDYRNTLTVLPIIEELSKDTTLTLWGEAEKTGSLRIWNRLEIQKTDKLAIINPPPNFDTLKAMLKKANPTEIYLFALSLKYDLIDPFMKRLIGLINYCLTHKEGEANLEQLAAALGHSERTAAQGLDLLKAAGKIEFEQQGNNFIFQRVKNKPSSYSGNFEKALQGSLNETAAYRNYYRRCNPDDLFNFT